MQFVTTEEQLTDVKCGLKQEHGQLTIRRSEIRREEKKSFLPDFAW
jgi:hypothetical protein